MKCKLPGDKNWSDRYLIFRGGGLAVYKDLKERQKKEQKPLSLIDVKDCKCEFARQNPSTKMFGFTVITTDKKV